MLFFFSIAFAELRSPQPRWTLQSPFKSTDIGEIGDWTLRGAAVSFRNFIRLTSAHTNQYGALCHRLPTLFSDWEVEISLNAYGGTSGRGFIITYSSELCPGPYDPIDGFRIFIDTREIEDSYYAPVYLNVTRDNQTDPKLACAQVPVRSDEDSLTMTITYERKELQISFGLGIDDRDDMQYCIAGEVSLPERGYFTVSAATDENSTDDHDVYMFMLDALSPASTPDIDYSSVNRRLIEDFVADRRIRKTKRRANMPLMTRYKVEGAQNWSLGDAFGLIKEALWRVNMSASKEFVEEFVNVSVAEKVGSADRKLEFVSERFDLLKDALDHIWAHLRQELIDIQKEMALQMNATVRDLTRYAEILGAGGENSALYKAAYNDALTDMDDPVVTLFFVGFCGLEALIYLAFFFYRLKRTNFFKKAD